MKIMCHYFSGYDPLTTRQGILIQNARVCRVLVSIGANGHFKNDSFDNEGSELLSTGVNALPCTAFVRYGI